MVDDCTLVDRCLQGDAQATVALIERYQNEVFGLSLRMLHHRQDAEDVTQEVFLRVFRSLKRWDRSRPLRPWLLGITINRCRTWLSQRQRRPELVDYLHDSPARDVRDDGEELLREIHDALSRVRADYRAVFVMFHEQNLSYEEIAAILKRPVGTVKTWLHRVRGEIIERLAQRGMVPPEQLAESSLTRRRVEY